MGVNGATEQQGVIDVWQRELDDPGTTAERRRQIVNKWTTIRVAETANDGAECLNAAAERDAPWNTQRAEVLSCARTAMDKLRRIERAMVRLTGADRMEIGKLVALGVGVLARNAETAYEKTLYPHEEFYRGKFLRVIEGEMALASGFSGASDGLVYGLFEFGGVLSDAEICIAIVASGGAVIFVGGPLSLAKAGEYIHMRATLPEMEAFPGPDELGE